MSVTNFEVGDLVWAKMKNCPLWPAQVSQPPKGEKRKKRRCYVCLLGSKRYAWVSVGKVRHHAEHLIPPDYENKPPFLKLAIDEIILLSKDKPFKVAGMVSSEVRPQSIKEQTGIIDLPSSEKETIKQPIEEKLPMVGKQSLMEEKQPPAKEQEKQPPVPPAKEQEKQPPVPPAKEQEKQPPVLPAKKKQPPVLPAKKKQPRVKEKPIKGKQSPTKGKVSKETVKISNSGKTTRIVGRKRPLPERSDVGETSKSGYCTDIPRHSEVRKLNDHSVSALSSHHSGLRTDLLHPEAQRLDDNQSVSSVSSYNSGFYTDLLYRKYGDEDDDDDRSVSSSSHRGKYRKNVRGRKVKKLKVEEDRHSVRSSSSHQKNAFTHSSNQILEPVPVPEPERESSPVDNRYEERLKMKHVTPTIKKIGFLGLGRLGRRIVKNLLIAGHTVIVWNRTVAKCKEFEDAGATRAENPAEVVKLSDIIISCVSDVNAVKAILFSVDGVLKGLEDYCAGGKIFKGYVEMSSIGYVASQEIANDITLKGGRYLEAPVTGTKTLTDMGALLILASGDACVFRECVTCFHAIADNAYFISTEVGDGSKFSVTLSMLMGTSYAALAEAIALGNQLKLDISDFLELLNVQGLASNILLDKGRDIIKKDFSLVETTLKNQQKDISLGLHLGDNYDQPCYVASAANEVFKHARLLGYAEHDVGAVYQGAKY